MTIETIPFFLALGFDEHISIYMNADTENYLDLLTKPMTGMFAGSLLAIEPVTRLMMIVKLSDTGIETADFVGAVPRDLAGAKQMIAEINSDLFAFKVRETAICLN